MSEIKKCPDCGAEITSDCEFCPDCGADLRSGGEVAVADKPSPSDEAVPSGRGSEGLTFGEGSRTNIGGNVNSSTSNISTDNSVSHVNTHVRSTHIVNESHVDQSSNVNSTTIIQNEKAKEYCGVCGKMLDENHARCPQCGKSVCVSCLVYGKNRCTKCEKQAVNDFRMTVKQIVLTSGGQLAFTEKEMIQQRAVQLDVEDVKDQILKEALESCCPAPRATQPIGGGVTSTQNKMSSSNSRFQSKGVGVLDQRQPIDSASSKSNGGKSSALFWIIVVAVLGLGGFFLFSGNEEDYEEKQPVQQVKQVNKETVAPVAPKAEVNAPAASKSKSEPRKNAPVVPQKVAKKVDQKYTQAMEAYNAGEGLEAVALFKKSGSAQAYYMLGVIYESGCGNVGENPMMARKFFKKAAAMGNEDARAKL